MAAGGATTNWDYYPRVLVPSWLPPRNRSPASLLVSGGRVHWSILRQTPPERPRRPLRGSRSISSRAFAKYRQLSSSMKWCRVSRACCFCVLGEKKEPYPESSHTQSLCLARVPRIVYCVALAVHFQSTTVPTRPPAYSPAGFLQESREIDRGTSRWCRVVPADGGCPPNHSADKGESRSRR